MKVEMHILVTVHLYNRIYQMKVAGDKIVAHRCIGSWDWTSGRYHFLRDTETMEKLEKAADAKFFIN
tara:strand:+ start:664 stop:864 length:201 start_codon:yes stop_codon:yes gene_type:complete